MEHMGGEPRVAKPLEDLQTELGHVNLRILRFRSEMIRQSRVEPGSAADAAFKLIQWAASYLDKIGSAAFQMSSLSFGVEGSQSPDAFKTAYSSFADDRRAVFAMRVRIQLDVKPFLERQDSPLLRRSLDQLESLRKDLETVLAKGEGYFQAKYKP